MQRMKAKAHYVLVVRNILDPICPVLTSREIVPITRHKGRRRVSIRNPISLYDLTHPGRRRCRTFHAARHFLRWGIVSKERRDGDEGKEGRNQVVE